MWMLLSQLLPGILAAAAITGAILFAAIRIAPLGRGRWAAAALGAGYAGGHAVAIGGWPPFPPIDAVHWLVYFSLAGMLFGFLERPSPPIARFVRAGLFALISAGVLAALLRSKFTYGWTLYQGLLWLAALLMIMIFVERSLHRLAHFIGRSMIRPETFPLVITLIAAGTSVALLFSGSVLLGQMAMILAAATALLGFAVWRTGLSWQENGLVPVVTWLLGGLWICGYFFADLPAASALLFASAPMAAAASVFCSGSFFSRNSNQWIAPAATALITAIAAGIAIHAAVPMDAGY